MSTNNGNPALRDHALEYSAIGWSIIPTRGKKAACKWKAYQRERPTPEMVAKLFDQPDITGVAVVLGPASGGLACRDFDVQAAYEQWAATYPDLAGSLPTVKTFRGEHVYFRALGASGIHKLPDGELRCSGGYCLLPRSRHPEGPTYDWVIPPPDGSLPILDPFQAGFTTNSSPPYQVGICHTDTQTHRRSCVTLSDTPGRQFDLEAAIQATLPDGYGQRHRKIFEFARILKFAVGLDKAPENLRVLFGAWHVRARPFIKDQAWQECWEDFQRGYTEANSPPGSRLETVFAKALADPIGEIDGRPELGILAALCRELQAAHGDKGFYLSSRVAAKYLCRALGREVNWKQALRWLRSLQFYGHIEMVKKGLAGTRSGEASEWRFVNPEQGGSNR